MAQQEPKNFLIPKHTKLTSDEAQALLEKYNLEGVHKLPKIKVKDQAILDLEVEIGDIIEITRHSFAGETKYYRVVVE